MDVFIGLNWIMILAIISIGALAFTISTLSGGGGSLLSIPIVQTLIGASRTAPVINLGALIGRPVRVWLFRNNIHWPICFIYIPSAILGAWIGAYFFSRMQVPILYIFVGCFLMSTLFQFKYGKRKQSFIVQRWHFIPLGLIVSILGTIIGGMGPVLNPFYLNYNLDKEDLIGTKSFNSLIMGLSQISSYTFFGMLEPKDWIYGLAFGIGAIIGNIIGKNVLDNLKSITFRKLVIIMMVISGLFMVFKGISYFIL